MSPLRGICIVRGEARKRLVSRGAVAERVLVRTKQETMRFLVCSIKLIFQFKTYTGAVIFLNYSYPQERALLAVGN